MLQQDLYRMTGSGGHQLENLQGIFGCNLINFGKFNIFNPGPAFLQ